MQIRLLNGYSVKFVCTSNVCPCAGRQVLKSNTKYTAHFAFASFPNCFFLNPCLSPKGKILGHLLVANLFDVLFVPYADRCQ